MKPTGVEPLAKLTPPSCITSALDFSAIVTIPWRGAVVWSGWFSAPAVERPQMPQFTGPGRMLAPRLGQVPQLLWALTSSFLPGGLRPPSNILAPHSARHQSPATPPPSPSGTLGLLTAPGRVRPQRQSGSGASPTCPGPSQGSPVQLREGPIWGKIRQQLAL